MRMPDRVLWIARHGAVDAKGICYGQVDVPCVESAEIVAARIVSGLGGEMPTRMFCSPLARAREPAECVGRQLGLIVSVDARLMELSMGAWEGQTWSAIEAHYGAEYTQWMEQWQTAAPPNGESPPVLLQRLEAFVKELQPGSTLAVAHAGVVRALRVLKGASWDDAMGEPVPYGSVTRFDLRFA
jgi:alpha-ribazole phosphatase